MIPGRSRHLLALLIFLIGISAGALVSGAPLFEVRFTDREVSFSGEIDSEKTGQLLAAAVRSVRPDLAIINAGLKISPEAEVPARGDLENILTELGISTHGGRIEIHPDYILLGGITDSVVTITALRIRIKSLLGDRDFLNRICVVPSDDLPDLKVSLSSDNRDGPLIDFEYHPSAEETFQPPGFPLDKWFPTLVMLSDFDRLEGKKPPLIARPLIAMPISIGGSDNPDPDQVFEALAVQPFVPQPKFQTLGSIHFSRNVFMLQANQTPAIESIAKALSNPPFKGLSVILKPLKASGGSGAFNEYTCEKRADEVKRILSEKGVNPTEISTQITDSQSPVDDGEVQIVVKIPPPPPPPVMEEEGQSPAEQADEGEKVTVETPASSELPSEIPPVGTEAAEDSEAEVPLKPVSLRQFRFNSE